MTDLKDALEQDIETTNKMTDQVEIKDGKYVISSEDLYKIFLGLLSLQMFRHVSVSNARFLCIKNKDQVIAGLEYYLNEMRSKSETE